MRLFIGIELDAAVRDSAAAIANSLEHRLARRVDARWVVAANLHITLWFIGEAPDDRASEIRRAVDHPFAIDPFNLHVAGLGAFPPSGAPRAFWLGVLSGGESLTRVHAELASRLRPLGIEPERRPYSAHLTIARVKEVRGHDYRGLRAMLHETPADAGTCRIAAVTVFRSRLSPKGATYEAVLRVPLQ
jgi:2'-5' RNA ligase